MYYLPSDDYGDFTFSGTLTNYSIGDFLLGLPNPSYFAVTGPRGTRAPCNGAFTAKTNGR
jgi:hypothetical protein